MEAREYVGRFYKRLLEENTYIYMRVDGVNSERPFYVDIQSVIIGRCIVNADTDDTEHVNRMRFYDEITEREFTEAVDNAIATLQSMKPKINGNG